MQAAAKAAILAECDRLTEPGITFGALRRRSAGDEGVSEDIKCYATEASIQQSDLIAWPDGSLDQEGAQRVAIRDAFAQVEGPNS